jgi:hypothetical protein
VGHIIDGLLGTGPIVDGEWVVAEPMGAVESGAYWGRTVPVLLGTNSGEGQTFIYDGVDFPLPGFLIPPAYVGLLGFNVTAGELANAQPRYNSSAYADGREPLSYMVVRSARGLGLARLDGHRSAALPLSTSARIVFYYAATDAGRDGLKRGA